MIWNSIKEAEEEHLARYTRQKKRSRRSIPAIAQHAELLTRESAETRAQLLAQHYNVAFAPKYQWKREGYFSDGSVIKTKDAQLVGAAVWRAQDEQAFRIQPNGHGPTNTINRAEGAAIYHILNDICPPHEAATIFTDSQVNIQRLQTMILKPHKLTRRDVDIHGDITRRTAELILDRAERGVTTKIVKVKSHTGIRGNEAADKAAKEAAMSPASCSYTTPARNPFTDKIWLTHEENLPDDRGTQQQAVPNLNKGLKQVIRAKTCSGFSRRTAYVRYWADTYADSEGAHPEASNLFWTSTKISQTGRVLVLKARSGTLYNQKLAQRYKHSATNHCPLCRQPDSVGHMLGGCQHRTMKGHYITRHDRAVRKIHKALQQGPQGGHYCVVDAGKMQDILTKAANGKRVPEFLLPDVDPLTLRRMRLDILRIKGLRANASPFEIQDAVENKSNYTIQIVEVGYAPDTRWRDTLARKHTQHAKLKECLEAAGWTVEEHFIILGRAGTVYVHTLDTLQALGLNKKSATVLIRELHTHSVTKLQEIVFARRRLERRPRGDPPDQKGVG